MGSAWRVPRSLGACLVWLASALPFLLEPFLAEGRLAGVSRAALAALPWIAWAGLPRASLSGAERSPEKSTTAKSNPAMPATAMPAASMAPFDEATPLDGALFDVALCLPLIALGTWIDLANGIARADVVRVAVGSAVLVFVLSLAARLSARSSVAWRPHALVWTVFVVGLPLLRGALEFGGAPTFGAMPAWITWIARASPLAWIVGRLDASASTSTAALGAFVVALVLLSIGTGFARPTLRKKAAI